jgi:L-seryl-tRNA(Ser) seleniumtransferase
MENVPTLAMLAASKETLKRRAEKVLRRVGKKIKKRCTASLAPTESRVGGGALPDQAIPSWAVSLRPLDRSVAELERNLRLAENAVIGRIDNDLYILDMRTVQDGEIGVLSDLLCTLLGDEG